MTPCILVQIDRQFGEIYRLDFHATWSKIKISLILVDKEQRSEMRLVKIRV
jgi:hypothetical protein